MINILPSYLYILWIQFQRTFKTTIAFVHRDLSKSFVPASFGLNHITRQEIIDKHTTVFAKTLFGIFCGFNLRELSTPPLLLCTEISVNLLSQLPLA